MDADRFDALVREFSRRSIVKGLAGALLGAVGGTAAVATPTQAQTLIEYGLILALINRACGPDNACPTISSLPCVTLDCVPAGGSAPPGVGTCQPRALDARTICATANGSCENDAVCNGASPECPPKTPKAANSVCAAASGPCENDAVCDGASTVCPAKTPKPAGEICRPARSACDVAETCTGNSAACPADTASICPIATTCCQREDSLLFGQCVPRIACAIVRRPRRRLAAENAKKRRGKTRSGGKRKRGQGRHKGRKN